MADLASPSSDLDAWREALARLTAPGMPFELRETQALGRTIRSFVNAPATLRDLYEQARGPATFLVYAEERLTFEQVWRRSAALAREMVETFGVEKGDRVGIAMRNYPEWVIAFNAATSIGAVAVTMNALWQVDELRFALADSAPKLLIVDGERLERLAAAGLHPGGGVVATRAGGALPAGTRRWEELVTDTGPDEMPQIAVAADDDAIMMYTSGSTGHGKGAVSTHRNVLSALLSWELDAEARALTGRAQPPPPDAPQPAMLLGIPLFHVTGLHHILLASYRAQRRVVAMYKWDPAVAIDLIEREQITAFSGPAAVTADLVQLARRLDRPLPSLTALGGGGAPRAPEQVRAIAATLANAAPTTGWGMTETNSIGTSNVGADYLAKPESAGRVSAVLDIRVVDGDDRSLPPMGCGELQIRGASIMRGYWNNSAANAAAFAGEWMRTGDVAFIDRDGFLFIVDRIKDLVIRGGENIGCGAVEAALLEHPEVVEASVYGVPVLSV